MPTHIWVPRRMQVGEGREECMAGMKGLELELEKVHAVDEDIDTSAAAIDVRTYTRRRFSTESPIVTVIVGTAPSARSFHLHECLLKEYSNFFTAALSRDWLESQQKTVRLPEDDPALFQIFADFLYSGRIYSTKEHHDAEGPDDGSRDDPEYERLARCWLLGDKLASMWLQDASVDAILQKMIETKRAPVNLHVIAYSETTGDNTLKRLAVDIAAWRLTPEELVKDTDHEHQLLQFYRDTIARLRERSCMVETTTTFGPNHEPWSSEYCELYHVHSFDRRFSCYQGPVALDGTR